MQGGTFQAMILAGAMALAGPLLSQSGDGAGPPPGGLDAILAQAEAARQRLDLPTALTLLTGAVETSPDANAPLIARAAIHRAMGRPSLSLADLNAVLARAPDNAGALAERAATWRRAGVFDKAAADFARARALRPDDAGLAAAEAAALVAAGRKSEALAAYVRASDLAPEDEKPRAARDSLLAELAQTMDPGFVFEAGALVGEEFTIGEGAATAPNHLILVRDGAALSSKGAVTPDRLTRAVAAGVLRITHVFTYSGRNSNIWANLALICAGPALGATEAALMSVEGRRALEDIERGEGTEALAVLIGAAYDLGGQARDRVEDCALNRGHALGYLADWTRAQEQIGWRGETYLDRAPSYVLNGSPVTAGWLDAWLAAQAPPSRAGTQAQPERAEGDLPDEDIAADAAATPDPDAAEVPSIGEGADIARTEKGAGTGPEAEVAPVLAPVAVAEMALAQITLPPPVELPVARDNAQGAGEAASDESAGRQPDTEFAMPDLITGIGSDPDSAPEARVAVPTAPDPSGEADGARPVGAGQPPASGSDPDSAPEARVAVPTAPDPSGGADGARPVGAGQPPASGSDPQAPTVRPDETDPSDELAGDPVAERESPAAAGPDAAGDDGAEGDAEDVRLARVLKGIWAPTLTQCLSYLDAIETPETLDQAMPDPNADPPLDAILVTSRRAQPFDDSGLICVAESFTESGDESDALMACTKDGADAGEMRLHSYPSGGPSPWLDVSHGGEETNEMRQCVTLGQLGVRFADLWRINVSTCTARAPLAAIALDFRPEEGGLWLTLMPGDGDMALPGAGGLVAAVDDVALMPTEGVLEDGSYRIRLGDFEDVARHLSLGMFLHLSASDNSGFRALRLPLLGSGRAMAALTGCAD